MILQLEPFRPRGLYRVTGQDMNRGIPNFLLECKRLDFSRPALSEGERAFYKRFNDQTMSLCRSLPEAAQTDSIMFLMRYAGIHPGGALDFFANYYAPIWSVLYWLGQETSLPTSTLPPGDVTNAVTAHAMALLLHSLDDHLVDGQVRVSPLTLLVRSEAWKIMNGALYALAETVPQGVPAIQRGIDAYYSSNQDARGCESLDKYCDLFRDQMAIVALAPVLLALKLTGDSLFADSVRASCEAFGIAWRLLDDIQDIGPDMESGSESAVCVCLPEQFKSEWKTRSFQTCPETEHGMLEALFYSIEEIKVRIGAELRVASSTASACNMLGFAAELRSLAIPFCNSLET